MSAADDPMVPFESREAWAAWLDEHHRSEDGVWIKLAKKGSGIPSVTYDEAVEVALCYGWIDGQMRGLDETWYVQRFTPRRRRSKWSKLNRERALALMERGEMKPAGLAEVERAQADGRWDAAYDSPTTATVPDDLRRALDADPRAAEAFAALDAQSRYLILYSLQDAKRPETRARRIERAVARLAGAGGEDES
jgi:uncharacterized protein YdeI (YjbR/CyaY-like superfamily)